MRRLSISLLALAAVLAAMLGVLSFLENSRGEVEFSTQPFISDERAEDRAEENGGSRSSEGGEAPRGESSDGRGIFSFPGVRGGDGEGEGVEPSSPSSSEVAVISGCEGGEVRLSGIEARLFELHNEERESRDLPSLCVRGDLVSSSRLHSEDMIERDYFAHETPEDTDAFERMESAGYTLGDGHSSIKTGENLAWRTHPGPAPDLSDAEEVVEGWLDSEGHRRNLLDPEFREVGVGAATGKYKNHEQPATMYTVNFGVRE